MGSDDWYRNSKWDKKIAEVFEAKLSRAKRKPQYLRIQASMLAEPEPEIALDLLDRYFDLDDDFDHAPAFVDQATAFLKLGRIEDAIDAYENALRREEEFPNVKTQAFIELPFLIVTYSITERFDQAIKLLEDSVNLLTFPIEYYKWNASLALVLASQSNYCEARRYACSALDAANKDASGFRYHPDLGLVGKHYKTVTRELKRLAVDR